jgi:hypothetical protein
VNLEERIEVFDRDSKLLDEISSSYPRGSAQHQALRRAHRALWHVLRQGNTEFQHDIESTGGASSPAQKRQEPGKLAHIPPKAG